MKNEPLVLIATAPNEPIAVMWAGILENEGIRSYMKGDDLKATMYIPPVSSMYRIYVLASQAEAASEVLKPFLEQDEVPPEDE